MCIRPTDHRFLNHEKDKNKYLLQKKGICYFYHYCTCKDNVFEYKNIVIRGSDTCAKQVFIKDGDKELLVFTLPVFSKKVVVNHTDDADIFECFIDALDKIVDIYMELGIFEKDADYFIRKGFDDNCCCNVCCKCNCNEKQEKDAIMKFKRLFKK